MTMCHSSRGQRKTVHPCHLWDLRSSQEGTNLETMNRRSSSSVSRSLNSSKSASFTQETPCSQATSVKENKGKKLRFLHLRQRLHPYMALVCVCCLFFTCIGQKWHTPEQSVPKRNLLRISTPTNEMELNQEEEPPQEEQVATSTSSSSTTEAPTTKTNKSLPDYSFSMDYMYDYHRLRDKFDAIFPESKNATQRRLSLVKKLRKHTYRPVDDGVDNMVRNCPFQPPPGYPEQWPMTEILQHWNPNVVTPPDPPHIYQGVCVFDYTTERDKALNYRNAGVPFVIRDDPEVLRTVERWNHPKYLLKLMNIQPRRIEKSQNNHFMFFTNEFKAPPGWKAPTTTERMDYADFHWLANRPAKELGPSKEHWYYNIRACGPETKETCSRSDKVEFMFDEMPYFQPKKSFYKIDPTAKESIDCRFGMAGVIAASHFDAGENMVALLGGERRYILSSPDNCPHMALFPKNHPSMRHSTVNWTHPDLDAFPQFRNVKGNEIVLQAGDVLYIPSHWFHFIVSLNLNWQCNTRSGESARYANMIRECGFDP